MSKSKAFDTALAIVQAEIIGEQVSSRLKPVVIEKPIIVEKPVEPPRLATEFIDLLNESVNGQNMLLDENGQGRVEKILLRSPSPNFSIALAPDYGTQLQGSYSDFQDVLSYQEDSTYVLEITNIDFTKNIRFTVTTTGSVTFSRIFIKYAIKRKQ